MTLSAHRWPRLMSVMEAAEYLSLSATTVASLGIRVRRIGRRVLYDQKDLDRWADQNDDQPMTHGDAALAADDEERRFFERRKAGRGAN